MRIAVIGGSGFIGRHAVRALTAQGGVQVVSFGLKGGGEEDLVPFVPLDLASEHTDLGPLEGFDAMIYAAGGADHALGDRNPLANLVANCVPLFRCLEVHRGRLIMLSSQAVYSGLTGAIPEDVDHIPSMPYGLAKAVAERHAVVACERGDLESLTIFRLMYAFGHGEADRRLIRRLSRQRSSDPPIEVAGMGRSFVNPLPAAFVGSVLASSARLPQVRGASIELVNLNHPVVARVTDVVRLVQEEVGCRVQFVESGEAWPVTFHGDPQRLMRRLDLLGLELPDMAESVKSYARSVHLGDQR